MDYYKRIFKPFKEFLESKSVGYINTITKHLIDQFILHLGAKLDNPVSINSYLRAVRVFLYYVMDLGYLNKFKVELIKTQKKVKPTYTDKELEKLLKKPDLDKCNFSTYRNWVIINYLLSTGNRLRTLMNLQIKDIDFENGYIHLRKTKNRKQQIIPLSKTLAEILQEYLLYRKGEPEDYIFCTYRGTKFTKDGMITAIKRYNKKRGVNKTSIHLFRHTFAKKWILAGGDIFRLQKILGYSSMEMVKEYVNMFSEDLKQDFDKFNPLEQMKGTNSNSIKMNR